MKQVKFLLVCLTIFVVGVECLPITFPSYEIRCKLLDTHKTCIEKSRVDESTITAIRNGVISDDEKLKNYVLCFSQESGIRDENGVLNKTLVREKTVKVVEDEAAASKLLEKCVHDNGNPLEDALNNFRCLYANSPKYSAIYRVLLDMYSRRKQMSTYHNECITKSSVDRKIVKDASKRGEFVEDPKFKSYLLCLSEKMGFMEVNGEFQSNEVIRRIVEENVEDSKLAETIVKSCFVKKNSPEDTAYFLYKCYYDSTPIHIDVLPDSKGGKNSECLAESGVDEQLVEKERVGEFTEDPKLKNYMYCLSKKIGLQNETGYLQRQVLKEKLASVLKDEVTVQKLMELCALDRSSPQDTAYYTVKCYQENTPSHMNILKPPRSFIEAKRKVKSYMKDCSVQSGVSKRVVLLARKGEFSDDPQLKDYLFCISRKVGLQNEQGELNNDVVRRKLAARLSPADVEKLIERCVLGKDTPQNLALEAFRCYYKEAPVQLGTIY